MRQTQLPGWAEALFRPARYYAIVGGRGSGKSRSIASALVLMASQRKLRILCAREIQKSIKDSSKRLLDDEIARLGLGDAFLSTDTEIRGVNGSLFLFSGLRSNIANIKSMEGIDMCWVDEAQSVSQASLDVLIPTIRKEGSSLWFSWNPSKPTDPVDAMFCGESQPPRTVFRRVNYDDNPWFPETLRADMEYDKRRDPDKYAHIWRGKYLVRSEASVFRDWRIVGDDEAPSIPAGTLPRFGADWGFSVDPTVLVRCWVMRDTRTIYVDREAYGIGVSMVDLPSLFHTVEDSERWPILADSSGGIFIDHMRKHGFPKMQPAIKGPGSVEQGVEWLKSFTILVHAKCTHTIDELTCYSYEVDKQTGAVTSALADKDNHVIDALRYSVEGDRRGVGRPPPPKISPIPTRTAWSSRRA